MHIEWVANMFSNNIYHAYIDDDNDRILLGEVCLSPNNRTKWVWVYRMQSLADPTQEIRHYDHFEFDIRDDAMADFESIFNE